jgi:hypothetical protein
MALLFMFPVFARPADPKSTAGITVTKGPGGSIKTVLSSDSVLNKDSSLIREWITIHDQIVPADTVGTIGVTTIYVAESQYISGGYFYHVKFSIEAKEPLSAVEVKFLTFDIWGNHQKTLNLTEIRDIPKGIAELAGSWKLWSENECSEFYASIAYISRIRTQSGRIIEGRIEPVLAEAKKFSKKFTAENLEPNPEKKP